jgi:hypothetical protein
MDQVDSIDEQIESSPVFWLDPVGEIKVKYIFFRNVTDVGSSRGGCYMPNNLNTSAEIESATLLGDLQSFLGDR